MSKAQKGEKGQYFTPRYVIDMCVKMMNPSINDKIIDTACGSSGFTVHSIFKVWKDIRHAKGLPEGEGFTAAQRIPEEINFVRDNVFAIDFDEKTVLISSAYADKYGLKKGAVITLKEPYEDKYYGFRVTGIYDYEGGIAVFMSKKHLNDVMGLDEESFSGFFSETEITDIESKYIGSGIINTL